MHPSFNNIVADQRISADFSDSTDVESPKNQPAVLNSSAIELITCPVLPPNFVLTAQWVERLFSIASTKKSVQNIGPCGTCMMQTMEMVCNFNHFQCLAPPVDALGLLFSHFSEDIIAEFRQTEPELCNKIDSKTKVINALGRSHNAWLGRCDLAYNPNKNRGLLSLNRESILKPILARHQLTTELVHSIRPPQNRHFSKPLLSSTLEAMDISCPFKQMMTKLVGTLWLMSIQGGKITSKNKHRLFGHMSLVIALPDGLRVCETNVCSWTKKEYQSMLDTLFNNHDILFEWLTSLDALKFRQKVIYSIDFYEVKRLEIMRSSLI